MTDPRRTGTAPHTQPPVKTRPKFERAFSHKVRTGCLTCKIRRKKCDEEKPTCRRCRDSSMKCDGYLPPVKKPKGTVKQKRNLPLQRLQAANPTNQCVNDLGYKYCTELEGRLFDHFFHQTCVELSAMSDPSNFWLARILPLAHTCEPVSHAITAVGAAHQLFLGRLLGTPKWEELVPTTLRQYNKAIAYITPWMSCESVFSTYSTLVCCLLFTCFESFVGRYTESVRHIAAGNRVISSLANPAHCDATRDLAAIFARLAVEASIFMEQPVVPTIGNCYGMSARGIEGRIEPFKDIAEASYELCALNMESMSELQFFTDLSPNASPDMNSDTASPQNIMSQEQLASHESLKRRFSRWNDRFHITEKLTPSFSGVTPELEYLRRQRHLWIMTDDQVPEGDASLSSECLSEFLDGLEISAQPLIALNKPTFTLDGNLISSISFVVSFSTDASLRSRALGLLRSLNRRECMWDSRDVVDLHEATLSLEDSQDWYRRKMDGGVPEYVRELSRATSRLNPDNGILVSSIDGIDVQ